MKTYFDNIAMLDLRKASAETIENIGGIKNVAMLIVAPAAKLALTGVAMENVATVMEIPSEVQLAVHNGLYTMAADAATGEAIYLMVNGIMTMDRDVTPEQIRGRLAGGMVNGKVIATEAQLAAVSTVGVRVNGVTVAYPEGMRLRDAKSPLTLDEARRLAESLFLMRGVRIERGVCQVLRDKGLVLGGNSGAVIEEGDADAFFAVWQGSGEVRRIPQGYTLMEGKQDIARGKALMLRGKRYIQGDLLLREDVRPEDVKGLEALMVTGELCLPMHLLDTVLALLRSEPELVPYEGTPLVIEGVQILSRDLQLLPEKVAIFANGVLDIDPGADPAALQARVTLLRMDGVLRATPPQQMALLPVLVVNGEVTVPEEEPAEAPGTAGERADAVFIRNVAAYTL